MPKELLEENKNTYQERLDLLSPDKENHLPFERAKIVTEFIRNALEEGKIFENLVRPEIPKAMLKAIDDSFVNLLSEEGSAPANMIDSSLADTMFSSISEAMENAINSEAFINQLGLEIARNEIAREKGNYQELGE